jgi:hypothetical protein
MSEARRQVHPAPTAVPAPETPAGPSIRTRLAIWAPVTVKVKGEQVSVLTVAADRFLFERGVSQGKFTGTYDEHCSRGERAGRSTVVARVLDDGALADKYADSVNAMIAAIIAPLLVPKTRTSKKGAVKAGPVDEIVL